LVCSCFQVGENAILQAIEAGCHSVEALSDALKCGSNCGSCLPEVRALLTSAQADVAAPVDVSA
jgi:assimilatory nitrate reductase catalytic subunit